MAISPDGKTALVSRDGDNRISSLLIDGTKVEPTKRDLAAGLRPYGLDIPSGDGTLRWPISAWAAGMPTRSA